MCAQTYFSYLDSEERKTIRFQKCVDTGIVVIEFQGDRYISDGAKSAGSPKFYTDNVWIYTKNEVSLRWELDLQDIVFGKDDDNNIMNGFNDDID
jgi:hypothetical protein